VLEAADPVQAENAAMANQINQFANFRSFLNEIKCQAERWRSLAKLAK